ncbi:unnamed protein product [Mytilus coruscus]|uniref:Mitochondria-eating protein n=1 Tax=Mytilus coruscus TaxID=42192 RepID=A0A6J8BGP6_MYTCO|nr:unnamed protein product [Mytilus coruscus]
MSTQPSDIQPRGHNYHRVQNDVESGVVTGTDNDRKFIEANIRSKQLEQQLESKTNEVVQLQEFKREIGPLRNEYSKALKMLQDYEEKINGLQREKSDALTRLSEVMGSKLRDNNPAITDLNDPNRPMKLGDQFSELYENEWTDAYSLLDDSKKLTDIEIIEILIKILSEIYETCLADVSEQLSGHRRTVHGLSDDEIEGFIKAVKDSIKTIASKYIPLLRKKITSESSICKTVVQHGDCCLAYIENCVSLCYYVAVQDPPMVIDFEPGQIFDKQSWKEYTRSGTEVEYVVWPALYLYKGGPIMSKGVVQPKENTKITRDSSSCKSVVQHKDCCLAYIENCVNLCYYVVVQDPPMVIDFEPGQIFDKQSWKEYTRSGTEKIFSDDSRCIFAIPNKDICKSYITKRVDLCYYVAVQDPPMVIDFEPGQIFDKQSWQEYTRSGTEVENVVWPALLYNRTIGFQKVKVEEELHMVEVGNGTSNDRKLIEVNIRLQQQERQLELTKDENLRLQEYKREIGPLRNEYNMQAKMLQDYKEKINVLQREKSDALTRLSEVMGSKLRDNNPAITDLNDPNRPMKLGDQFSELYENEWTDAYSALEDSKKLTEIEIIEILIKILNEIYETCLADVSQQLSGHRSTVHGLSDDEIEGFIKAVKDSIKTNASKYIPLLRKKITSDSSSCKTVVQHRDCCLAYIENCVNLCYYVAVQDPPMVIDFEPGQIFDKQSWKEYTRSGTEVEYVVWPALYLYKGGSIMSKGVVQPKENTL